MCIKLFYVTIRPISVGEEIPEKYDHNRNSEGDIIANQFDWDIGIDSGVNGYSIRKPVDDRFQYCQSGDAN